MGQGTTVEVRLPVDRDDYLWKEAAGLLPESPRPPGEGQG
jgi:hypothetical protein